MNKVEILHLDFQNLHNTQAPLFCPFTGKPLIVEDPYADNSDSYPESVIMTFSEEFIEDGPVTINKEFQPVYKGLCEKYEIENEETLIEALNSLNDSFAYMVITCGQYGIISGDGGSMIFVLRKDNCLINT